MDRPLMDANQVTPTLTKKWCVLIQVVQRSNIRTTANGLTFRNYILTDTKGTMIPMIMYDKAVRLFSNTLEPYKRYYLSNASVKNTLENYRHLEYPYTWTLNPRNLVELYEEPVPPPFPCTFHFDKFNDFYRYADQERPICIKALVVEKLPIQQTSTSSYRDCVVVNEEMIPMLMQVWDDVEFDTNVNVNARYKCPTMIVANGLRVTTQHGLSLRTKVNAYILEEPPLAEDKPLKEWYTANAPQIRSLVEARAYRDPTKLFHPPRPSEILPLSSALASIEKCKAVWTEGALTFLPGQQHLWFEACEKCLTPLDVDMDWKIMCSYCKELTNVVVRSDIGVFLSHNVTVVEASVKSPEIDRLLPVTANDMRLAALENKPLTKQVEAALQKKHVICFLKYYDQKIRGSVERRYPLLKLYTEAEISEYNAANQQPALAELASKEVTGVDHIGTSSSTPKATTESQFFTPSMKTALHEVLDIDVIADQQATEHIGAKRMLPFQQPEHDQTISEPKDQNATPVSAPNTVKATAEQAASYPAGATETTPTKKQKGNTAQK